MPLEIALVLLAAFTEGIKLVTLVYENADPAVRTKYANAGIEDILEIRAELKEIKALVIGAIGK